MADRAIHLPVDMAPSAVADWQLAKQLSIVQTAITANLLSKSIEEGSFDEATLNALDVSSFGGIRVGIWGVASDGNTPVIDLYGWNENGPGHHIGTITLAFGNFASTGISGFHAHSTTHKSIRDEFVAGTAYRGCDTYTETNDYEGALSVSTQEANFPGFLDVDFANNQYKWLLILVTNLGSATTVGAIFKALSVKRGYSSPQFTG